MEIAFVQDEAAAIQQARAEIPPDDLSQLLDFNFAKRVATECSSAATDTYTTTTGRGGRKRKTRFDNLVGPCNKLNLTPIRMVNHLQLLGDGQPCI